MIRSATRILQVYFELSFITGRLSSSRARIRCCRFSNGQTTGDRSGRTAEKFPIPEDAGPYWYGYSVAKWEGDTFVVETVGLDSREWLDDWGVPFSESLRLQERWHRLDRDNLELTITGR